MSTEGSGGERLDLALRALCQVAERNLPLLAHTDLAFHQPALDATGVAHDFFGPWLQILTSGRCDGSLPTVADPHRFVVALTDMVLLTYVHLRAHHAAYRWSPEQTTDHLLRLVATGYLPAETSTEADSNRDDT